MRVDEVEELGSAPEPTSRRLRLAATWAAVLVVAALVVVRGSGSHHRPAPASAPRPPTQAQAPTAQPAPAAAGVPTWVFLEPVPECQRTQPQQGLRLAIGVMNLGGEPLRVAGVTAVIAAHGVAVTDLQVGGRPCPNQFAKEAQLLPSHELLVGIALHGERGCAASGSVSVLLTLRGADRRILHAESSNLLTADTQRLLGCTTT